MWLFFWNFLKIFSKTALNYVFINCANLLFSTPTWILSNYQTFLKFYERQVQNFLVFCKIYTNSFIIYPGFFNIFSMILKFPRSFSKYSSDIPLILKKGYINFLRKTTPSPPSKKFSCPPNIYFGPCVRTLAPPCIKFFNCAHKYFIGMCNKRP